MMDPARLRTRCLILAAALPLLLVTVIGCGSDSGNGSSDTLAPMTMARAPEGWQDGDTKVRFEVDDVSAVRTYSAIDDESPMLGSERTVRGDGVHKVEYWSVDAAGNEGTHEYLTVKIDSTSPVVTLPRRTETEEGARATLVFQVRDAGSRAKVTIRLSGPIGRTYQRTVATNRAVKVRMPGLRSGTYGVKLAAVDAAGNRATETATGTLRLTPSSASAEPKVAAKPTAQPAVASKPSYAVAKVEDVSFGGSKRYKIHVVMSGNSTASERMDIARREVESLKGKHPFNAACVFFWKKKSDIGKAMADHSIDYAPGGDWSAADTVSTGDYASMEYAAQF